MLIEDRASQPRAGETLRPTDPPEPGSREELLRGLQRDKPTPIDMDLTLDALWTFTLVMLVAGSIFFLLRPWLLRKKVHKRQRLHYDKIITDESNVRGAIRVEFFRPVTVTGLRVQGKLVEFAGRAASLDLSMGGMSLLSTFELPPQADLHFCFHESEIASSPPLNGLVLQSALWNEAASTDPSMTQAIRTLGSKLYLVRLSFVNLAPESKSFLTRLIAQKEREGLAAMKNIENQEKEI